MAAAAMVHQYGDAALLADAGRPCDHHIVRGIGDAGAAAVGFRRIVDAIIARRQWMGDDIVSVEHCDISYVIMSDNAHFRPFLFGWLQDEVAGFVDSADRHQAARKLSP